MIDFTTLFRRSGGEPVIYEGREIQPSFWLPVSRGEELQLTLKSSARAPVQGLQVVARAKRGKVNDTRCKVEIAGRTGTDFVLWTPTAPRESRVKIIEAPAGSQVGVWNVWQHPRHETMLYGVNNAGMRIEVRSPDHWVLECSDGVGDPDFTDLVVELRKL
jgi:hypothetical protein